MLRNVRKKQQEAGRTEGLVEVRESDTEEQRAVLNPDWKQRQVSQQMGPEKERLMHKFKV